MPATSSPDLSRAVLRPVRGQHAFEACVERLGTAIRLGVYPSGEVLPPERDLAVRLEVSRATLREAIAALRAAGLVETHRGRGGGSVVSYLPVAPTTGELVDLADRAGALTDTLVFRRVVEPGAAHLAASRRLSPTQRRHLREAHAALAAAEDPTAHRQADSRFHLTIATVTDSALVTEAVARVQADLHDLLSAIPVLGVNIAHSNEQHASLLAAILAGQAPKARRVMENHCDDTAALLRGLLD